MTLRIPAALFGILALVVACEEEVVQSKATETRPLTPARAQAQGVQPAAQPSGKQDAPPAVEFQETDFAETERSRDPFRSFVKMFAEQSKTHLKTQREVVLEQYAIDELKLVGIVTRVDPPRAMLVDPTGKGTVVHRGQFIGRAEIVQGGKSGADYEINWRVERIRDSDIVLVREDPANPDVPTATRIIPLRPEESG